MFLYSEFETWPNLNHMFKQGKECGSSCSPALTRTQCPGTYIQVSAGVHVHTHTNSGLDTNRYVYWSAVTCVEVMLLEGQVIEKFTIIGFILIMLVRIQHQYHITSAISKMICATLPHPRK